MSKDYYRSQAQKRLRLAYEYAREDLEAGRPVEVYHLCTGIAGVELSEMFSGPESNMWQDIRTWGRYLRFYPEYTIGEDFVDFADPHKRIAIEIDSRLHNRAKDLLKDARLQNAGFSVIRIEDTYTKKDIEDIWDAIRTLEDLGKQEIADSKRTSLSKNSEMIVMQLRDRYTPTERPSEEELIKTVTLGEVSETEEFKTYNRKYFTHRPKALDDAIAAIPLYKQEE